MKFTSVDVAKAELLAFPQCPPTIALKTHSTCYLTWLFLFFLLPDSEHIIKRRMNKLSNKNFNFAHIFSVCMKGKITFRLDERL